MLKGLGRGLESLIPRHKEEVKSGIEEIEIDKIKPNRYQPRKNFNQTKLHNLIASIQEKGIVQPVLVRKIGENEYELIAGERRLRAAKEAKLSKIPVVVKDVKDGDMLELALIENIQRDNLDSIEEANAYKRLIEEFNLTHEEIAKKVGKDRSTITNILRLLNLPDKIQEYVSRETISVGHAMVLLGIEETSLQDSICENIIKKELSVRQSEALASKVKKSGDKLKGQPEIDIHIADAEKQLQYIFGTKVKIKGRKKGKIEIYYYTLDELNRIYEIMKKME
ncbi:MAG: ParB/RepB/Spo0J family partition protein [Candidatus Firestonebacteria bacterium]